MTFPELPELEWYYVNNVDETLVPSDWFIDVAKFKIEYDGLKKEYEILKQKNEELNGR